MTSIAQTLGERRVVDTITFVHPSGMSGLGAEVPARGMKRFVVLCVYIARDIIDIISIDVYFDHPAL